MIYLILATCDDGGEPLVSGAHYMQDEYIRSYYYGDEKGTRQGISEPKREAWNARLDKVNEGNMDGSKYRNSINLFDDHM